MTKSNAVDNPHCLGMVLLLAVFASFSIPYYSPYWVIAPVLFIVLFTWQETWVVCVILFYMFEVCRRADGGDPLPHGPEFYLLLGAPPLLLMFLKPRFYSPPKSLPPPPPPPPPHVVHVCLDVPTARPQMAQILESLPSYCKAVLSSNRRKPPS